MLGHARAVALRVRIWSQVAQQLSGITTTDQQILRRALFAAPVDVFRQVDRWRDPMVAHDCHVMAKGIGTFRVRAKSDDLYHVLPARERAVIGAILELLRPGDCFVDAGANIGVYSVLASRIVRPDGQVIAIEMMPETAAILKGHLAENNCENVVVIEGALSSEPGLKVVATVSEGKFGQASITTGSGERTVEVETTTLARVLSGTHRVRLLKMDLEGAELGALRGAEPILDCVEAIIFEHWGHSTIKHYLTERGFEVERLDGRNSLAIRR